MFTHNCCCSLTLALSRQTNAAPHRLTQPSLPPSGTDRQEFIKRNGQFTVNVGLCEAGVPVLGVVGVPAAEEPRTYFAVKGEGAFVEVRVVWCGAVR